MPDAVTPEFLRALERKLADEGLLIEAGWVGLRLAALPINASQVQVDEMRSAFFAGATHVFHSVLTILDPEAGPTEADMRRMDLIDQELRKFLANYKRQHGIQSRADH